MLSLLKKTMTDLVGNSAKCRVKTAIWTVKISLVFVGIISTVLLLKIAIPYSLNLLYATLPSLWNSFRSWLSPPYLYIIVNFIIITIAASNSFQRKLSEKTKNEDKEEEEEEENAQEKNHQKTSPQIEVQNRPEDDGDPAEKTVEIATEINSDAVTDGVEHLTENEETSQTLDATWKAITGGAPLTRHLKKSDTWKEERDGVLAESKQAARWEMTKSETFSEGLTRRESGVRRELSTGEDELNRRVEEFIKKFRLERQESDRLLYGYG
eukprot:TRINITY_DN1208_c2_g3_i1.p1 TRINITY_DN1208_c2_g3~~TRINITY_DN1208_c2_g3_i1.p1  ORF type:complete len:268 (-),score=23.39 TRINITY_DN1208_c2_g3_i1:307-1110(-)